MRQLRTGGKIVHRTDTVRVNAIMALMHEMHKCALASVLHACVMQRPLLHMQHLSNAAQAPLQDRMRHSVKVRTGNGLLADSLRHSVALCEGLARGVCVDGVIVDGVGVVEVLHAVRGVNMRTQCVVST